MNVGAVVGGAVLILIAAWVFMTMSDPTAKFVGGGILGIVGLVVLATGFRKK